MDVSECFEVRKELCTEGVDWTYEPKERVRSKVTLSNLGGGVKCKKGAS